MVEKNLYELGEKLGLNRNDIDQILRDEVRGRNQASLSLGVYEYDKGILYGSVSFYDF